MGVCEWQKLQQRSGRSDEKQICRNSAKMRRVIAIIVNIFRRLLWRDGRFHCFCPSCSFWINISNLSLLIAHDIHETSFFSVSRHFWLLVFDQSYQGNIDYFREIAKSSKILTPCNVQRESLDLKNNTILFIYLTKPNRSTFSESLQ